MKHRQHRLSLLIQASFASSAVACAGAAMAQDAPVPQAPASAASGAAADLGKVTVTGFRASLQRAMEVKRNANAIVDAISAEDIGKFPDTNAAESLSHLPGIAVDRYYGEGEKVSINGTDPALNRILVNGQTIASGDWGGNPTDTSGRTFNYTLLAPEIIGLMEVYKSPEARIDEGSIGGTVIVHTRRPLDLPANTLRGSAGYTYNDRSRDGDPRMSMLGSWKNDSANFGFIAAYTHDKQRLAQAGIETFSYSSTKQTAKGDNAAAISPTAKITGNGTADNAIVPSAIDSDYFQQVRQRDGLQGALQWKPDEHNELNLTGIYIRGKYNNFSQARFVYPAADGSKYSAATINDGLVTAGTITPTAGNAGYGELDANYRISTVKTKSISLQHDFTYDKWKLTSQLGYTAASGGKDREYLMKYLLQSGGYSFSYGPKSASVTYDDSSRSNWGLAKGQQAGGIDYEVTHDNEKYAQLDLARKIDLGPVDLIRVGAKILHHENNNHRSGNSLYATSDISLTQFGSSSAPSNLYNGLDVSGDLKNWPVASLDSVVSYLNGLPQGAYGTADGNTFTVVENTRDAYVQADYDVADFRGNFGVRYVNTGDESSYYLSANGTPSVWTTTPTSYNKFLPSLNIAYDLDSSKVLRFSMAKVIARPRYSDLAGATNLSDSNPGSYTGSGGNPQLKPYESTNYDFAADWFFTKQSMVGTELFVRDVGNYVVTVTNAETLYNTQSGRTNVYQISSPVNVSGAIVRGISLYNKQELPFGFGAEANYTYISASGQAYQGQKLSLPYLSKNVYSIMPYFEKGPFSAHLVYNWRSKYFTQLGTLNAQNFSDAYKELAVSASYQLTKQISVSASGSNLLDSTYYQYADNSGKPVGFYKNGRVFHANISFAL